MNLTLALILATSTGLGFDPGVGTRGELTSKYLQTAIEVTSESKYGGNGLAYRGTLTGFIPIGGKLCITPAVTYQGYRTSFPDGRVWAKTILKPGIGITYGKRVILSYYHATRNADGGPAVILELRYNHKRIHAYGSLARTWWGGGTGTRGAVGLGVRL
jgi:hypothetical protein